MPQEFQILRCYSCEKFQVHQTKKATKWQCKVCGEKQSLKKAFFIGSARDCRLNVQKLNFEDGERKQNCIIETRNESLDIQEEDSFFELGVKNGNYVVDKEIFDEPSHDLEYELSVDMKKPRYEINQPTDTNNEEDFVWNELFDNNDAQAAIDSPVIPSQEEGISFDVGFSLDNNSSDYETNVTQSLKVISDTSLENAQLSKRPEKRKNRGFQLILNAAKKLK